MLCFLFLFLLLFLFSLLKANLETFGRTILNTQIPEEYMSLSERVAFNYRGNFPGRDSLGFCRLLLPTYQGK